LYTAAPWLWGIKRLGPKYSVFFPARIYVLVQEYVMLCYICYLYMFPFSLLYKICANKIRLLCWLISFQSLFWICSVHVIFHYYLCGFIFLWSIISS
jgi:hypothetical protein